MEVDGSQEKAAVHSHQRRASWHAMLPAVLFLVWIAGADARSLSQSTESSYSGISWVTPERFPPPKGWRLIAESAVVVYGPQVVANRTKFELAYLYAGSRTLEPLGLYIRYVNYTAHPSLTPGLEYYNAVVEHMQMFSAAQVPLSANDATTIQYLNEEASYYARSKGVESRAIHQWVQYYGNVTLLNSTAVLSRVELRGHNLLPFHFDKQLLFLESVYGIFMASKFPIGRLNISDWKSNEAATNGTRRLLADAEPLHIIHVDVWFTMEPSSYWLPRGTTDGVHIPYTLDMIWSAVSSPDTALWEATQKFNVPMNLTFKNATLYDRPMGAKSATISYVTNSLDPASQSLDGDSNQGFVANPSPSATKSAGLSAGAIGAIVAGACVFLAALGLLLLCRRRWSAHRDSGQNILKNDLDSETTFSSEASQDFEKMTEAQTDPSDIEISKHPDGSDWVLGSGTFGRVYKAIWQGTTVVAVKMLNCRVLSDQLLYQMMKEAAILHKVSRDKNIVQYYGASFPKTTHGGLTGDASAMIVMEYMEGGTLQDALWLEQKNGTHELDWSKGGKQVALDVARGLHFLHSSGVIHRDVKSSNILLTKEGVAKVADVGLALMSKYFSSSDAAGTFTYAAPELLTGERCTAKVDVYSFGVLLWEIVTKEVPQRGYMRAVRVPQECSAEVKEIIEACARVDAEVRPSMREIVDMLHSIC